MQNDTKTTLIVDDGWIDEHQLLTIIHYFLLQDDLYV